MSLLRSARHSTLRKLILPQTLCRSHAAAPVALLGKSEEQQSSRFPAFALLLGAVGCGALVGIPRAHQEAERRGEADPQLEKDHPTKQEGFHLLDTSVRRRVFYKYERRIRDFSQSDKIFHYFATVDLPDGTRVMSPADLLRAVVAVYPAEGSGDSRSGRLPGEPGSTKKDKRSAASAKPKGTELLNVFDTDDDGISFPEYLLLLTFLKIPVQDVNIIFQMFDLNGDGLVHQTEFEQITSSLQRKLRNLSSPYQRTGQNLKPVDNSRGLKRHFFGEKGDKALKLEQFLAFMEGLHEALLRLEFDHYRVDGRDTITGLDFARSIISSVDLATVDSYLDRAASLPANLAQVQVTLDQFRHFSSLHQQVHKLAVALDFYHKVSGKLEKRDFSRATKLVTGKEIPPELVDIVYHLFDTDNDGNLSQRELLGVLRKREGSRSDKMYDEDEAPQGLFSCLYDCLFERS